MLKVLIRYTIELIIKAMDPSIPKGIELILVASSTAGEGNIIYPVL